MCARSRPGLAYDFEGMFEALRGDAEAVRRAAALCIEVSREHGLRYFCPKELATSVGRARISASERRELLSSMSASQPTLNRGTELLSRFFKASLPRLKDRRATPDGSQPN